LVAALVDVAERLDEVQVVPAEPTAEFRADSRKARDAYAWASQFADDYGNGSSDTATKAAWANLQMWLDAMRK
jgi:hypothetical protein